MRTFAPIQITDDTIGKVTVLLLSITFWLCEEDSRSTGKLIGQGPLLRI